MNRYKILSMTLLLVVSMSTKAIAQDSLIQVKSLSSQDLQGKVIEQKIPLMDISGMVVDAAGKQPLSGIQIQTLNDMHYTAMTDEKGHFSIKVPVWASALFIHGPQYLNQQVAITKGIKNLKIRMISDHFKSMYDNTTRIAAERVSEMNSTTSQSIETDIGDMNGADVHTVSRSGGPGYGASMFIRGLNSLNANAQPLIIVDGIIQDMQSNRTALHDGDYNNMMLNINPEDIEKVSILKNGTAIYGSRGGNGVILISTKRGYSMATRIDANIGIGVVTMPKLPDMMNASQYRLYASEMLGTYPNISSLTGSTLKFLNDDTSKYYYNTYHNDTDWSKEVYQTAMAQNYNINVQGGDNVGMYNLSLGYTQKQSTAKDNDFNRLNVRFNTDINVVKKVTTKFDLAFSKIDRNVFDNGAPEDFTSGTVSSPTFLGLIKAPILNPYTYNSVTGKLSSTLSEADDFLTDLDDDLTLGNPVALLENGKGNNKNRVETTHFNTVIAPKYQISPDLALTEIFSYNLDRISQRYYRPVGGMPTFLIEGIGSVQSMAMSMFSKETSIESDTRLSFSKQFGAHFFDIYGGFRFTSFSFDDNEAEGQYSTAGNDKTPNISTSMDFQEALGADDVWKNAAWYGNLDYNYRNRYFTQLSFSLETSSRFGDNSEGLSLGGVKWGVFPSLQLGWLMSNESWFPKSGIVNYLLLRSGYDISGNDDISNYAARTSFSVMKYLYRSTAAQLDNIGNDKISYEKVKKFNLGFSAYLLHNRMGMDFDVYKNHTSNLLTLKKFDNPVAGINQYWSNGGALDNTGFELTFTGKPVITKNFNVELGLSIGHYENKIKSLPDNGTLTINGSEEVQGYTSSIYGTDNIATIVGHPVGVFYGYKTAGVFATDAEASAAGKNGYLYMVDETGAKEYFKAGDMHFVDLNGDGIINDADKTIIGNPNPDAYGNLFTNITWKDFTLAIRFNYSLGNDVYNYQRSILESESNFYNQTTAIAKRWRNEGDVTDIPRLYYDDPMGNARFSDRWIEDGSYLRLKTLNLTYKVPVNTSWLQGLSIWAEVNNLFTITKYLGSDPEFSAANGVLYQGIDTGNVPISRTFTFGLKINL